MRTLETIQLAVVALAVLIPAVVGFRLARGRVALALIGSMIAQLLFEGFRWQLVPLEMATVGLAAGDLLWEDRRVRGFHRIRRSVLGVMGLALIAAGPIVLPVPELPRPTGAFEIGTRTFVLVDAERSEQYGLPEPVPDEEPEPDMGDEEEEPGEPRRLVVQAWFPARVFTEDAERASWNPDIDVVGPAVAERIGVPSFFLSHVRSVESHAYENVPPMSGRMPVVIYSHGWTGFRGIALDQIEALASSGFLVLAADHTYGSIATRFPDDGTVIRFDPRALPDEETVDEAQYDDAAEQLVETFADDLTAIVAALDEGAEGPFGPLADSADTSTLGFFGHSTGGGAALAACLEEERCSGVAGLDPWVEPVPDRLIAEDLVVPSMFLRSGGWIDTPNDLRLRGVAERSPAAAYLGGIPSAGHGDFVMTPLLSPVGSFLGLRGEIDGDLVLSIVSERLVGFFERHLLGLGGGILDEPPPAELEWELLS